MTHFQNPTRLPPRRAFTLLELLVVLAILAVVSTGIAVTYGRKNIDESKDKMALHEMHEIKKAFLQFESDNYRRLREDLVDHTGTDLPTAEFESQFETFHIDDDRLEGRMEFYETYGLWFLILPKISDADLPENRLDSDIDSRFPVFENYNGITGEGWNGPYLDVPIREAWTLDDVEFPQIADKHGGIVDTDDNPLGVYRMLYYEHREILDGTRDLIYRRLLLIAPRGNTERDELTSDELLLETGNLRGGLDQGRLDLDTGAFINEDDSPFFILELLNMDILPE